MIRLATLGLVALVTVAPAQAASTDSGRQSAPMGQLAPARVVVTTSTIVILEVTFRSGSASFDPPSREAIEVYATMMQTFHEHRFEIVGHADKFERDGWSLSARRAAAVRDALIELGVPPAQITSRGAGNSERMKTSKGNRRVSLHRL